MLLSAYKNRGKLIVINFPLCTGCIRTRSMDRNGATKACHLRSMLRPIIYKFLPRANAIELAPRRVEPVRYRYPGHWPPSAVLLVLLLV